MITQRLTSNENPPITGRIVIETTPGDVNGLAELYGLHAELKLRANIKTEGSIITPPSQEEPPPTSDE